jgi:D-alanine-D-alanine ligase
MKPEPQVVVLCGAVSPEREVSLRSGRAVADALPGSLLVELNENALPAWLQGAGYVAFPVIHGDYGEDGQVQADLTRRGVSFAGCDEVASRLCIDKVATKRVMRQAGVPAIPEVAFSGQSLPTAEALIQALGEEVVIKPADKGSSVGLYILKGREAIQAALRDLDPKGQWMVERRLRGRELSVGILQGQPMGLVEIVPVAGVYDFKTKYTAGASNYLFPAPLTDPQWTIAIQTQAGRLFAACGCRDFARADVILEPDGKFYFLEINTMPGMTETSLMPKSASCLGLDFPALVQRMIAPALQRARHATSSC